MFIVAGKTLYEPGVRLDCACFPAPAIVSLEYVMVDGASAEVAIVGSQGVVGIALFMGGESQGDVSRRWDGGKSRRTVLRCLRMVRGIRMP